MPVAGIAHVQIAAPPGCETAARRFFGELLGIEELAKPGAPAARGGVWFRCGEQQLHVGVERDFTPARKAHPALVVAPPDELDRLSERLAAAGHEVSWDDSIAAVRRFYVLDPWGNRVELTTA